MFTIAVSWPWGSALRAWANDHGSSSVDVVLIRDRFGAFDDDIDVVCLAPGPAWIDQALVSALIAAGTTVVGVFDSPEQNEMWQSWGVDRRMSVALEPADQLGLLEPLCRRGGSAVAVGEDALLASPADELVRLPLVFGGAPGAGAREVALNVAAQLGMTATTVLIDANESSGGVAHRLGYADTPNVLDATECAAAGRDLREVTTSTILAEPVGFDVIAGLPADVAWTQWSASDAAMLIDHARSQWDFVVVTTSPIVEDLRRWGGRYGVSRMLLSSPGSAVVAVVEASSRGVVRAADWFAQARPLGRVPVVINKVPARSTHIDAQIRERLLSILGEDRIDIVATLPVDRAVQSAEWNARLPQRGRFARAVRSISRRLGGETAVRKGLSWQA